MWTRAYDMGDELGVATPAVGPERIVDRVLDVEARRTQYVAAVDDGVGREVVVHHFPFYNISRKHDKHALALHIPVVEVDTHRGDAPVAVDDGSPVEGVALAVDDGTADGGKLGLLHAAKLLQVSQNVKFWRIFIHCCLDRKSVV